MARIAVTDVGEGRYRVDVSDGDSSTSHVVDAAPTVLVGLGVPDADPERAVRESFSFLLEREPATSILSEFSLEVIARYFPEYRAELPARLGRS